MRVAALGKGLRRDKQVLRHRAELEAGMGTGCPESLRHDGLKQRGWSWKQGCWQCWWVQSSAQRERRQRVELLGLLGTERLRSAGSRHGALLGLGDVRAGEKAVLCQDFVKGKQAESVNYRAASPASIPGKIME